MAERQEKQTSSGNGGRAGSGDIDREITALREDLTRLSEHVAGLLAAVGNEASRGARETSDEAVHALEDAIYERPLTTLAIAVGLGFVLGNIWRK